MDTILVMASRMCHKNTYTVDQNNNNKRALVIVLTQWLIMH